MLRFSDGRIFATGKAGYQYRPVSQQDDNRILLQVRIDDLPLLAVVDTGSPYVIIQPAYARLMSLDSSPALDEKRLRIRGNLFRGSLHRLPLLIPAVEGESMQLEVTAFVPQTDEETWGDLPSFLGMMGCLERLRFAVDPQGDVFYFGAI